MTGPRVLVVAVGNEMRGDDGVGPAVARSLPPAGGRAEVATVGDPVDLLGRWDGADLVVVADAMRPAGRPGRVAVFDLDGSVSRLPPAVTSHSIGLHAALRLARALGRGPRRVVVVGVEAGRLALGEGLSPPVAAAVPAAARVVGELARGSARCA